MKCVASGATLGEWGAGCGWVGVGGHDVITSVLLEVGRHPYLNFAVPTHRASREPHANF